MPAQPIEPPRGFPYHPPPTMALIVQKFGGSSVATADRIHRCAARAVSAKRDGHAVVVVVSAMGDTTDDLIQLATDVCNRGRR